MSDPPNTDQMTDVNSWDEVPEFAAEEEEHEFWASHSLGDAILDQMVPVSLEDELASAVRVSGWVAEKEFTLVLHLPQDIAEQLAASVDSPERLAALGRSVASAVRLADELGPEAEEDLGWLDYLHRFLEAQNDCMRLLKKITEDTLEISQRMDQETGNLKGMAGNPQAVKHVMMIALRTAKFINDHAEETKKDVLELRQHVAAMSDSFFSWLGLLKEQRTGNGAIDVSHPDLANLQGSIQDAITSIKKYREAVLGIQGFQRDLNKASSRLANVLQHLLDTLSEFEVFVEMAVKEVGSLG